MDWLEEFNRLDVFDDSQWADISLDDRQHALETLIDTLDVSDSYEGYSFQVSDLPDGDFVSIEAATQTITFDRDALNLAEAKDSIINDLFYELNVDEQIADCFERLYQSDGHICYEPVAKSYTDAEKPGFKKAISFGCLGICGTECVRYGGYGRKYQIN